MTRVDFYSLEPDSRGDRFILACRLVERIRAQELRVLILCPDREEARHLDRLLWTLRQESFLPHGLVGSVDAALTPILISLDGSPASECQVLLNLSRELPPGLERFERLCDLVDNDPALRQAGRARFRAYRERGYAPNHHQIRL
ncbi:DNA polymerase III subunit chi [Allochromatium palmeri]|uniref:DNA polymerase III subunit chi n=1 Tax=Allochromatium palmeri TaxID=231048 RepID=A0A6N8EHR7_9GAMM|nr:DNA polymerase III subunit chi [Allochromatium palmeri]MTW22588.1 DNA polymerase III subunit chi [Allochromatium palmeri]